jgi:hypothetical protein
MKYTRSLFSALVAASVAFAMVSTATAQAIKDGAAKVVRIKGSARYSTGNNVWQPLSVGDVLRPGTVVQTDRDSGSYVDLVLGDGGVPVVAPRIGAGAAAPAAGGYAVATPTSSRPMAQQNTVRLFENTVLGIDKLTATETGADVVTDTQLDLKAGHILGNVRKMSAASRYEIKLPNGVAGIRGTVFHIWADGRIQVASGTVVLSLADAAGNVQTRVITAGNEYNPRTDQILPLASDVIQAIENSARAFRAEGTVFINSINANPDMVLVPLTPNLTVREDVSPINGDGEGDGDGGGE